MWLAVVCAGILASEPTGELPPIDVAARMSGRLRGAIGASGAIGVSLNPFAAGVSPGLDLDLGVTVDDRVGVSARVTGGFMPSTTAVVADLAVEFTLLDSLFLSTGLGMSWLGWLGAYDVPFAISVVAPVRITYLIHERAPHEVARSGVQLFLEALPGITVAGSPGYGGPQRFPNTDPPLTFMATAGVGYAWK